jgi:hypothetical protein
MSRWLAVLFSLAVAGVITPGRVRAALTQENFHVKTASDLVALCSAEGSDDMTAAAVVFCHGYAVGVYQSLAAEQAGMQTKLFCVPNPAPSRTEAIAAFVTWAKASPAVLSQGAPDAILGYLMQRFPCAGGTPSTVRR